MTNIVGNLEVGERVLLGEGDEVDEYIIIGVHTFKGMMKYEFSLIGLHPKYHPLLKTLTCKHTSIIEKRCNG